MNHIPGRRERAKYAGYTSCTFFVEYHELDVMYLEMTLEDMNKVRVVAILDPYIVSSSEE